MTRLDIEMTNNLLEYVDKAHERGEPIPEEVVISLLATIQTMLAKYGYDLRNVLGIGDGRA